MSTPEQDAAWLALQLQERFQAGAVIDRMRQAWELETDLALAHVLRTTRQAISKWRSRNSIPYAEAVYTSYMRSFSLDWILKGDGEQKIDATPRTASINVGLLMAVLLSLYGFELFKLRDVDKMAELETFAKAIKFQYERAEKTVELLQSEDHMSEAQAVKVAIAATELLGSDGTVFRDRLTPS